MESSGFMDLEVEPGVTKARHCSTYLEFESDIAARTRLAGILCLSVVGLLGVVIGPSSAQPAPEPPAAVTPAVPVIPRPLPLLTVRLSQDVYHIRTDPKTGAPIMPKDVVAKAELVNWPADVPQPQTFTWHVFLDWDFKPYPTHHAISGAKFEHPSPFPVNLSAQVRGGKLKIIAKTLFEGREVSGQALAEVRGDNPPRSAVLRAFPPNRFGLIASKIAMAESGIRQFNPDGTPTVSRTNDVGMMQLNAPTAAITSADQVWDWRANLKRGLEMLEDKRRTTVLASRGSVNRQAARGDIVFGFQDAACVNFMRWYLGLPVVAPPVIPELSRTPGSGIDAGEADPDHLALNQVERDAIRRYNGGHEYALALVTDPDALTIRQLEWQIDPSRGGIRERSGDPAYVQHVLSARSGFVIPAPPKPSHVKHRRRRHHRAH